MLTSLDSAYDEFGEPARRELVAEARREAEHLHRFATNLVHMTRLEAAALDLHREPIAVAELVEAALGRARAILAPRKLLVEVPAGLPDLRADAVLIEQALFNVLENAAKYTPPDATVTLSARRTGDAVMLRIADTGPGIPPNDLDRIFVKFYRAAAGTHGTGLGLAICRGFIEAHGGTVTAANRPDRTGAIFTIVLPVTERGPGIAEAGRQP